MYPRKRSKETDGLLLVDCDNGADPVSIGTIRSQLSIDVQSGSGDDNATIKSSKAIARS